MLRKVDDRVIFTGWADSKVFTDTKTIGYPKTEEEATAMISNYFAEELFPEKVYVSFSGVTKYQFEY